MTQQPEKTRVGKKVVNADEFGASRSRNEAILRAFEKGLISSATIVANIPAFEEACQLVRQHNLERRIGLHLNLTEGEPLTDDIADCPRFCDAGGCGHPHRQVLSVSRKGALALEAEIVSQIIACERENHTHAFGFAPPHTQRMGVAPSVIRMAKRHGINAIPLRRNCGTVREGASAAHRMLAPAYRHVRNTYLRFHGLARTEYFGNARDTAHILQTTTADVEVMVHPRLADYGRLVDLDG